MVEKCRDGGERQETLFWVLYFQNLGLFSDSGEQLLILELNTKTNTHSCQSPCLIIVLYVLLNSSLAVSLPSFLQKVYWIRIADYTLKAVWQGSMPRVLGREITRTASPFRHVLFIHTICIYTISGTLASPRAQLWLHRPPVCLGPVLPGPARYCVKKGE